MKQTIFLIATFSLLLFSGFLFTSCCSTTSNVKAITTIQDGYRTLYYANEDYCNDISILVTYDDGTTQTKTVTKDMTNFVMKQDSVWDEDQSALYTEDIIIEFKNKSVVVKIGFVYSEINVENEILSEFNCIYEVNELFETAPIEVLRYRKFPDANNNIENNRYERKQLITDYEYVSLDTVYTSINTSGIYQLSLKYKDIDENIKGALTGVDIIFVVGEGFGRYDFESYDTILNETKEDQINFVLTQFGIDIAQTEELILEDIKAVYSVIEESVLEDFPSMPNTIGDLEKFYEDVLAILSESLSPYIENTFYMPEFYIIFETNNALGGEDSDYIILSLNKHNINYIFINSITGEIYNVGVRKITCDGQTLTFVIRDTIFGEFLTITYKLKS